jgi:hypothetical protein
MRVLKLAFGLMMGAALTAFCVFNGLAMLLAPKWWLKLPPLVGFQGTLRGKDGDDPWVSLQIRLLGLAYFLFFLYFIWLATSGLTTLPRLDTD